MIATEKTLTEVLAVLRERGYTKDFNLLEENLSYTEGGPPVHLRTRRSSMRCVT